MIICTKCQSEKYVISVDDDYELPEEVDELCSDCPGIKDGSRVCKGCIEGLVETEDGYEKPEEEPEITKLQVIWYYARAVLIAITIVALIVVIFKYAVGDLLIEGLNATATTGEIVRIDDFPWGEAEYHVRFEQVFVNSGRENHRDVTIRIKSKKPVYVNVGDEVDILHHNRWMHTSARFR